MKIYFVLIVVACLSLSTLGCKQNTSEADKAREVAKNFIENVYKGHYEEAKAYGTEGAKKIVDLAAALKAMNDSVSKIKGNDYKFQIVEDSIGENDGWIGFIEEDGDTSLLLMTRVNDKWLVDYKK
ncbi:MAG: DUF4878 domain-containing protein [Porphyromonas sp.]|nr:DUF4878 domain-containing protein [Porphyromonas sp.]